MSRKKPLDKSHRFPIDLILNEYIDDSRGSKKRDPVWHTIEFEGRLFTARLNSLRYLCFRKSGIACVCCGQQASHFLFQEDENNPGHGHFNLYGLLESKTPLLFTKDHIVPRALKGSNDLSNFQTMCKICNFRKGHTILSLSELRKVCVKTTPGM